MGRVNKFSSIKVPRGQEYFWKRVFTSDLGKYYYVHTSGIVAVEYENNKVRILTPYMKKRARYVAVKLCDKERAVKHLVAAVALREYSKGMPVINIDDNPWNNDYHNLAVISKKKLGRTTGGMAHGFRPVIVTRNGIEEYYPSIRSAAKGLYCSYQTVLYCLENRYHNNVLKDIKIEEIYHGRI